MSGALVPARGTHIEHWARMTPEERKRRLDAMDPREVSHLLRHWESWARAEQLPPPGEWSTWLILAGRAFGKTRAGAEWVRDRAERTPGCRIALVGATASDVRKVMVEGESGLMEIAGPDQRPTYEPSLRRLRWPNGSVAHLYSAAEPESLRGPQHHFAWGDEIAKWANGIDAWDNMVLGMRGGTAPRAVATTTPRPVPLLRRLMSEPGLAMAQGATAANRLHLPGAYLARVEALYGRTRFGRQELAGELIDELEGALWTRALIEKCRARTLPEVRRVVVAVDPPAGTEGDACGIVAVALGADDIGYVIEDATVEGLTPDGWARAVAACAERHGADRVVAESNNGGRMVEAVLRAADAGLPVTLVHASRGKVARAEPVQMHYAGGKVRHVGAFPELEDQMCGMMTGGGYEGPGQSPDRADALVWALTELMKGVRRAEPGVRVL